MDINKLFFSRMGLKVWLAFAVLSLSPIEYCFSAPVPVDKTGQTAINKAIDAKLTPLHSPYMRPFQYVGMTVKDAAKEVKAKPNKARNISVENDLASMYLEAEGNFISFVSVELKQTAPCYQNKSFDSDIALGLLDINPSELTVIRKVTHSHTFSDNKRKLQVMVMCEYDGAPLSVSFSSKYYGQ